MATPKRHRTNPNNSGYREEVVEKIRLREMFDRAQRHVMGEEEDEKGNKIEFDSVKVSLLIMFANKCLPNLASTDINANITENKVIRKDFTGTPDKDEK